MTSRLTVNVNCSYVKDWNKTHEFLRKLNPYAVVAVIDNMSNRNRVYEIKQDLPNALVIARCIIIVKDDGQEKELDGSMHLQPQDSRHYLVSPADFVNTWAELGTNGNYLSYFNEPMVDKESPENITRQVQHMVETISYATEKGVALCLGNWGAGHYLTDQFDPVIELMGKLRDKHIMGFHAYSPIDTLQCIKIVLDRCKVKGYPLPRMAITEFGFDAANGDDTLNGYKSRGISGVQFGEWGIDKVKNFYSPYIQDGTLEFVAVFGWGYEARFPSFDVEADTDWQTTVLDAAAKGLLDVPTKPVTKPFQTPVPMPSDASAPLRIRVTNTLGINLRSGPSTDYQTAGSLANGDEVTLYQTPFKQASNGQVWRWVSVNEKLGGWVCTDVLQYTAIVIVLPPPVVIPDMPPDPVVAPAPFIEITAEYANQLALYYAGLADVWAKIAKQTKLSNAA